MPNSLELFEKLREKYREIVWHSNGFSTREESPTVVDDRILYNEELRLIPGFLGYKDPISHIGYAPQGQMYSIWMPRYGKNTESDWHPSFNVRRGSLAFDFTFDPTTGRCLIGQLEEAALRALRHGPFNERCFFMDPKFELRHPSNKPSLTESTTYVEFSHTGNTIPGLYLGEVMVRNWTFFIPEGPEREAVQMALDLEQAQANYQRDPKQKLIKDLQKRLKESLSAIAM